MSINGNRDNGGKWALAFWIVTGFTVLVGGFVISNDRMRASEDIRILEHADGEIEKVEEKYDKRLTDIQVEQRVQGKQLTRIEAKL